MVDGEQYTPEEIAQAAELYPYTWVLQNNIKNEVGLALDFDKRPFLKDIYNDLSPKQVILKPPQVGMTVCNTLKSLYVAKKLNRQIIYTLPTQGDVQDMVGGSFNRIIAQNPVLMDWVKDHDTIEQKSVGNSMIFYRGTFTSKQAMMIPSGLNIHDEVDASNHDVITQYENRLQAQDDGGWRWYFSHPSVAGYGVDIYWQMSDKKEWVIQCLHCMRQQVLVWPESVNIDRGTYICKGCVRDLEDEWRIRGDWKPTAIGEFSGYHISQLMLHNKSAEDIIKAKQDPNKNEQYFSNYVLGLPYVGSENKITSDVVLKNVVPEVNEQGDRIIIGVDTGLPIHLTCMNKQGVFYYKALGAPSKDYDPYDELEGLLKRWNTSIIVADQGGDLIGIRKLQAKYPGRVYLVYYRKDRKNKELIEWGEGDKTGTVRVDRNDYFQLMVEQLRDTGRIRLNGKPEEWREWAEHFDNVYREVKTVMEKPGKDVATNYGVELIWKRNGPDHYCFIEGTKIATNKGDKNIENIKEGDLVYTHNGYMAVYDSGLRRKKQKVFTAYFSNGSSFTATGDHPIIHTKGKTKLEDLSRHAILYECQEQKKSTIMESHSDGTLTLLGGRIEFTSHQMEPIGQKDTRDCISKYGLMPMEIFLKALSYIIKTKIRLITSYLTWCAKVEANIKVTMRKIDWQRLLLETETQNTLHVYNPYLMPGGVQKQEKNGIRIMLIRASFWLFPKYLRVLSAILKALHGAIKVVSSVAPNVVIVGLHENIVKKDVINISVEQEHEYFANGILVSNCHTLLYCLVGMDKFANATGEFIRRTDMVRFPSATKSDNSINARRLLGKRIQGYADF